MNDAFSVAQKLIEGVPLPRLTPLRPAASAETIRSRIETVLSDSTIGVTAVAVTALRAGLWQWHDFLDESHALAQSIEGELLGDCWHAVMHRREPDYGNAKYWYRRLGRPAHFEGLNLEATRTLANCPAADAVRWASRLTGANGWNPLTFVDLCETCAGDEESPLGLATREIQRVEMRLLLELTCAEVVMP